MATLDVTAIGVTVNSGTTVSKSVTSNATGNRGAMVLGVQRDAGGTGSLRTATCTYGGTSMTLVSSILLNGHGLYCWKLANPLTGARTVTMTCTTNSGSMNIIILTATAVDQTTVVQNFNSNNGNSTTGSVAVTSLGASDIAGALFGSSTAGAGWTNGSQDANSANIGVDNSGSNTDVAGASRLGSNGTSNMTYAVTTGNWAACSGQFKDAGGGSTKNITVATTGTSAPAFKLGRIRPIVVAATGKAAPSFGLGRIRPISFATTGHAAPSFGLGRVRPISFATTGKSAPSFTLARGIIRLAVTGTSHPAFAMLQPIRISVTGKSFPVFGLTKTGVGALFPRWGWRFHPPTEILSRITGKAEGRIWKG